MPDDYFNRTPAASARRSGPSLRAVLGTALLAFIGGAALVGWLVWDGRVSLDQADSPAASARLATLPQPGETLAATPSASAPSPTAAASETALVGGLDQRIAALEQRLTRLDLQAAAADGNTARAEALLVAFAARRAVERGAPLGYLADQLKLRFGDAQPNAVGIVIDAAQNPVTLDQLVAQFDQLAPVLTNAPRNEGGWDRLTREFSGLFVIRQGDAASTRPQHRLDRLRVLLRTGQVDGAITDVQALPGAAGGAEWLGAAKRYVAAQRALDLIETTALLEPNRLQDSAGDRVQQSSPAAPAANSNPAPTPAPTTAVNPAPAGAI
ncbi:hypothetical protein [Novosphingobium sp.]|uniref:hypothetical protein n=1 Tax=Novosphingobium sp. TaxID=1874826 RepID=UPI002734B809|nr:hypothetical protein [Novosphingobium sp.]MDP3908431.1 hypothetical protein [Novosphingobium sp.]